MSLIACRDVSFGYDGNVVLQDVNFTVDVGDYLCIVGENGSGKSTLMKGLLRLKAPLSGQIETGDGLLPREIGYLPQQSESPRDFPASVAEVVLSGRLNRLHGRPFYSRDDRAAAKEAMETLDILPLKNRCFQDLSGGQRQRVLLARALCATQKLLLLDEPAAGLDPVVTGELYRQVAHLNRAHHIAVIMVSHDLQAAMDYATHVLHLGHRQLFFGTREAYAESEVGRGFLGGDSHA